MRARKTPSRSPSFLERWPTLGRAALRSARWTRAAAAGREALALLRILERHGLEPSRGGLLLAGAPDQALVAGLEAALLRASELEREPWTLVEAELGPLVEEERPAPDARRVRAALPRLPFEADCFDLVLAAHPLEECASADDALPILAELVRVSARLVVLSHADPAPLPGRRATSLERLALARALSEQGAEVVDVHHAPLLVGRRAWLVAHKKARLRARARRVLTAHELLSPVSLPGFGGLRSPA